MRLILETFDTATASVRSDVALEIRDIDEFRDMLRPEIEDFDPRFQYELDSSVFARIRARYSVALDPEGLAVRIRPSLPPDSLPYTVHTNRELALMLEGKKPLAVLTAEFGSDGSESYTPEAEIAFDDHVQRGRFVKREVIEGVGRRKVRNIYFALPGEEWRIEAHILLRKTACISGWNEGFERMEGSLLGYEDWQNDIFIQTVYVPNLKR